MQVQRRIRAANGCERRGRVEVGERCGKVQSRFAAKVGGQVGHRGQTADQAERLDELMWEFDEDAYIPHQVAGQDEDDDQCPVLIAVPGAPADPRPMVINLRDEVAPGPFERVLEVVPADPAARAPLRERWKAYQARGFALKKHDM